MKNKSDLMSLPTEEPVMRVVPIPADANFLGVVFGGWGMNQADIAGSIPAIPIAGRLATVGVDNFKFIKPIRVGDIVSFYANVINVGTTSVTVQVEGYSQIERAIPSIKKMPEKVNKVLEGRFTYVAIDKDGQSREF